MPEKIIKRDGQVVAFDQERIINAILKQRKLLVVQIDGLQENFQGSSGSYRKKIR